MLGLQDQFFCHIAGEYIKVAVARRLKMINPIEIILANVLLHKSKFVIGQMKNAINPTSGCFYFYVLFVPICVKTLCY
jgi:hypothetical protein